jgi:hypothetical protein
MISFSRNMSMNQVRPYNQLHHPFLHYFFSFGQVLVSHWGHQAKNNLYCYIKKKKKKKKGSCVSRVNLTERVVPLNWFGTLYTARSTAWCSHHLHVTMSDISSSCEGTPHRWQLKREFSWEILDSDCQKVALACSFLWHFDQIWLSKEAHYCFWVPQYKLHLGFIIMTIPMPGKRNNNNI